MTSPTASRRLVDHPAAGVVFAGLFACAILALALRFHTIGDYDVETDFLATYVPQAKQVLAGSIPIDDYRGPLYPILLAACSFVSADFFRAGIVLSALAAFLALTLTFSLFQRLFPAWAALIGTVLVAVNPVFLQYSYTAGTDMVFLALALTSTFLLLTEDRAGWRRTVAAGMLAGGAYLTRYNGLFLPLAAPFVVLIVNPRQTSWRVRGRTIALFLGAFVLTIAPYGFLCLAREGSFFYNKNYRNIAHMMFMATGMSWDEAWNVEVPKYASLGELVVARPRLFFSTVLRNIWRHALGDLGRLVYWRVSLLSLAGLPLLLLNRASRLLVGYCVLGTALFGLMLPVLHFPRYSLYLLPLYTALALSALTWNRLQRIDPWRRFRPAVVVGLALIAWSGVRSYQFNRVNMTAGPGEVLTIAAMFNQSAIPRSAGSIIAARKPHIAYSLDMELLLFPYVRTEEELMAAVRRGGATFLFFSRVEAASIPECAAWLDPANAPPDLVPLLRTENPPAVLYGIRPTSP